MRVENIVFFLFLATYEFIFIEFELLKTSQVFLTPLLSEILDQFGPEFNRPFSRLSLKHIVEFYVKNSFKTWTNKISMKYVVQCLILLIAIEAEKMVEKEKRKCRKGKIWVKS